MCITEVWTYRECGCTHERSLPCAVASVKKVNKWPSQLPSFRSVDFSTIQHLGYPFEVSRIEDFPGNTTTASNEASVCHRHRVVNRFVHKQFLESICDDCLMKELASETSSNSTVNNQEKEILEVHNLPEQKKSLGFLSVLRNKYKRLSSIQNMDKFMLSGNIKSYSDPCLTASNSVDRVTETIHNPMTQTSGGNERNATGESVSERLIGSFNSFAARGRVRSPSKDRRRRGIDISHDDLRISSQWSSSEQRSMKKFRDALKEAANDQNESAFSKFVRKQSINPSVHLRSAESFVTGIAKSMSMTNLKQGLGRSKRMHGSDKTEDNVEVERMGIEHLTTRQQEFREQYYADERRRGLRVEEQHSRPFLDDRSTPSIPSDSQLRGNNQQIQRRANESLIRNVDVQSWVEHLEHDLALRSQPRKPINLDSADTITQNFYDESTIPLLPKSDICFASPNASRRSSRSSLYDGSPNLNKDIRPYLHTSSQSYHGGKTPQNLNSTSGTFPPQRMDEILCSNQYSANESTFYEWSPGDPNVTRQKSGQALVPPASTDLPIPQPDHYRPPTPYSHSTRRVTSPSSSRTSSEAISEAQSAIVVRSRRIYDHMRWSSNPEHISAERMKDLLTGGSVRKPVKRNDVKMSTEPGRTGASGSDEEKVDNETTWGIGKLADQLMRKLNLW